MFLLIFVEKHFTRDAGQFTLHNISKFWKRTSVVMLKISAQITPQRGLIILSLVLHHWLSSSVLNYILTLSQGFVVAPCLTPLLHSPCSILTNSMARAKQILSVLSNTVIPHLIKLLAAQLKKYKTKHPAFRPRTNFRHFWSRLTHSLHDLPTCKARCLHEPDERMEQRTI